MFGMDEMAEYVYDGLTLPEIMRRRAISDGERTYVQEVDGASQTYAECEAEGRRWAAVLRELGVKVGDRVAAMLPPCASGINAWLGVINLGALEVPIHTDYRGQLLEYVISNCGAKVLIIDRRYCDRLSETMIQRLGLKHVIEVTPVSVGAATIAGALTASELLRATPALDLKDCETPEIGDVASILYTSGTTGPSKGVVVTWRQIAATCWGGLPADDYTPEDIRYCPFPLCHVLGKSSVLGSAMNGAGVVLRESLSVTRFWSDIERYRCTTVGFTGAVGHYLYNQPPRAGEEHSPLRNIVMSPLPADLDGFRKRFGVRVYTCYNMTELSTPIASTWNPENRTSCGQLRDGYHVQVVGHDGNEVEPGETGELLVRHDDRRALMREYFGMEETTEQAWRDGWFHTGDAFRYDEDGNFYFVDRRKDSIRRRGENISSLELEREVNSHPAVLESAVVGVPSAFGDDDVFVAVVAAPDVELDPADLEEYLRARVPRFMIPRYIEVLSELPKTPIGKIQKAVLRERGVGPDTRDFAPPPRSSV
jgi:crotonobetaine/carnitine-CoA ligase